MILNIVTNKGIITGNKGRILIEDGNGMVAGTRSF